MTAASQLNSDKKLVNHSTRKHLVQKLVDNNMPPNEIVQITGHKNINLLNNYLALSEQRQQHIPAVLCGGQEPPGCAMILSSPKIRVDEVTATSTVQPSSGTGTMLFFYQCQVGTVNVFTNSDQKSGEFEQNSSVKRRRIIIDDSDESK